MVSKNLKLSDESCESLTLFTQFLIRENEFREGDFQEWIFCPGMLFHSKGKWWGDYGRRHRPHEGLDLCLYKDRHDRIARLGEKTRIPVMCDGVIVSIVDDFLGKSIIMEHDHADSHNSSFCAIYAHTIPVSGLAAGAAVKGGDIVAVLANPDESNVDMLPHLHISLGWPAKSLSYEQLNWETIGASDTLTLFDPLNLLGWPYRTLEAGHPSCRDSRVGEILKETGL